MGRNARPHLRRWRPRADRFGWPSTDYGRDIFTYQYQADGKAVVVGESEGDMVSPDRYTVEFGRAAAAGAVDDH